jgi:catechol 2,3-dioxygenase-like lactoylglutathione lyase family enzyme
MMKIRGVVETAISVSNVEASARFYEDLFGFERLLTDPRICAMNVAPGHVFLIFQRGESRNSFVTPGGMIPGHDAAGTQHFAFSIATEDFDPWCDKLRARGIEIESTVTWPLGGRSIYFRDPDQHAVELATPGVWVNY